MVLFKGKVSEPIQKELGIERNTKAGVRGLITTIFLIAPCMFVWLLALSFVSGKDSIFEFDVKPLFIGAIVLTVTAVVMGVKSVRNTIWPEKKLPPLDVYEYVIVVDEKGVKSTGNFASIELPYNKIKKVFKGEGYFIVYGKKVKRPLVLEEQCITDGSFEEVEKLLGNKISQKKHTNREKLEKTNTYAIVGIVCSSVLLAATIPLIMLILGAYVAVISYIIENVLIPFSSRLWEFLFPDDDIIRNILLGIIFLPLFIIVSVFVWGPVLIFVCGIFFMIYPSILCSSLIFPLKQWTVNKNKMTKFAIIFAICTIFASIAEAIIYVTLIM